MFAVTVQEFWTKDEYLYGKVTDDYNKAEALFEKLCADHPEWRIRLYTQSPSCQWWEGKKPRLEWCERRDLFNKDRPIGGGMSGLINSKDSSWF